MFPFRPNPTTKAISVGTPIIASILATLMVGASQAVAGASEAAPVAGVNWHDIVEKSGTIGVLVWIVVYFQRQTERNQGQIMALTERAVTALERSGEANSKLADSIERLRETMHDKK
jgi:hypothetical protein